jgi:hypothetical protein
MVTTTAPGPANGSPQHAQLPPPLHPAARRRLAQHLPEMGSHTVILRPIGSRTLESGAPAGGYTQLIHTSRRAKWVKSLMADLKAADWQQRLGLLRRERRADGSKAAVPSGMLELHLPIHRRFQIILFEAVCKAPGTPRLDPKSITGAGMVLRRIGSRDGEPPLAGWMSNAGKVEGWLAASDAADYDPNPAQRRFGHKANAAIQAHIAAQKSPVQQRAEDVITLHVAPPDVCTARGKTILFGLIPVASSAAPDDPPPPLDYANLPALERAEMVGHFSPYLKARPLRSMPRAGEQLAPEWNILAMDNPPADMAQFATFLRQVSSELNLFSGRPAVQPLAQQLQAIRLPLTRNASSGAVTSDMDAFTFLSRAKSILLDGNAQETPTQMPLEWPAISAVLGDALSTAALNCLTDSYAKAVAPTPKFARPNAQYAIKAFVRTKGQCDCPDRIQWSGYSEPFRILEWWEGDGPGARIALPEMDQLRSIKPNVSFDVPASIAKILGGDMKKLAKGENGGEGPAIAWLCSFSIPIITLCAFIVLHIFLALLDFIFRWMLWIKICVPIPKGKQGG